MASIEEKREALDQTFKYVFTQWRAFTNDVESNAAEFREMQEENASLREQLRALVSKLDDADRLRQENQSLEQQLQEVLAAEARPASDDEHFSVPATPLFVHTPPPSDEMGLSYSSLLKENHEQAAMIRKLTDLLRAEKEKAKRWRLVHNISSSPTPTSPPCPVPNATLLLSSPSNHLPYRSTAFDPKPLVDPYSLVLASPEPETLTGAKPVHIKAEPLQESSGHACKRRKISPSGGAESISAITEDGEDHNMKMSSNTFTARVKISKPALSSAHRRLGNLLAETKPIKPRLLGPDAFLKPRRAAVHHISPPRRARFLKPKPQNGPVGPEDEEPLRARPLHRLSLNHFKINPDTNEGLDFAYQEVVRNHHARKCLSGCTDKCCVYKFRAIAHTLYDTDNRGDETLDEQISNNSLLLDMLGPNSEEKIRTLTPAARANLIEEAKVRELAGRYSKHRAAHPRAASPPGFWDADMPCTQETAENREKAEQLEKEEVERRYRDAMRDNGRWMFADE